MEKEELQYVHKYWHEALEWNLPFANGAKKWKQSKVVTSLNWPPPAVQTVQLGPILISNFSPVWGSQPPSTHVLINPPEAPERWFYIHARPGEPFKLNLPKWARSNTLHRINPVVMCTRTAKYSEKQLPFHLFCSSASLTSFLSTRNFFLVYHFGVFHLPRNQRAAYRTRN